MLHYTSCGLDYIWLRNGYTAIPTNYGEATSVHDIEGLHRAIGLYLINNVPRLSGPEIRFLRKELDLSQTDLANFLNVSESTIRAWENDRSKISGPAEILLRALYQEKTNENKAINDLLKRISQLNKSVHLQKIFLEETDSGWKQAA